MYEQLIAGVLCYQKVCYFVILKLRIFSETKLGLNVVRRGKYSNSIQYFIFYSSNK